MTELSAWVAQSRGLAVGLGVGAHLALDRPQEVGATGLFLGALPLWSAQGHTVALLALPPLPVEGWPGVVIRDDECWTVSSDRRTLLPQLLLRSVLRFPDRAGRLRDAWHDVEPRLQSLHSHLGGDMAGLTTVGRAVASEEFVKALSGERQSRGIEHATSSLFRSIDGSPQAQEYADWLDSVSAGRAAALRDASAYGAWSRRVLCWSEVLDFAGMGVDRPPEPWRQRIIEELAGIDTGMPVRVSWQVDIGDGSAETVLLEAAMRMDQSTSDLDPVTVAIAEAMEAEGPAYRGLAHAEAVVVLNQRDQPERAWGALQSANWWAARSLGEVPDFIPRGGRLLAQEHGWSDILGLLDLLDGGE